MIDLTYELYVIAEMELSAAVEEREGLFARIKKHLDKNPHLTQKDFTTELIIKALDEAKLQEDNNQ